MNDPVKAGEIFGLALSILHDMCPPDNTCYLCKMGCMDECGAPCEQCWENYLFWVYNGKQPDKKPYHKEMIEEGLSELGRHLSD